MAIRSQGEISAFSQLVAPVACVAGHGVPRGRRPPAGAGSAPGGAGQGVRRVAAAARPGEGRGVNLPFTRHGGRMVADGIWSPGGAEFTPTVALTGRALRLRLPARRKNPDSFHLTQWLDSDRVVLDPNVDNGSALLVCRLSTGAGGGPHHQRQLHRAGVSRQPRLTTATRWLPGFQVRK